MGERVVIIDGNSLINRACYAETNDNPGRNIYTRYLWFS